MLDEQVSDNMKRVEELNSELQRRESLLKDAQDSQVREVMLRLNSITVDSEDSVDHLLQIFESIAA